MITWEVPCGKTRSACGFLEIFMTQKVLESLSKASRDSPKPTKMTAQQENNFWKDCEQLYLLKDTFEWMNLNETEHLRR